MVRLSGGNIAMATTYSPSCEILSPPVTPSLGSVRYGCPTVPISAWFPSLLPSSLTHHSRDSAPRPPSTAIVCRRRRPCTRPPSQPSARRATARQHWRPRCRAASAGMRRTRSTSGSAMRTGACTSRAAAGEPRAAEGAAGRRRCSGTLRMRPGGYASGRGVRKVVRDTAY